MGYRELLKKYVRFLDLNVGDNFIEVIPDAPEQTMTQRDPGELRSIAAEIFREMHERPDRARVANFNYRFRILLNHHGVSTEQAAVLAGVDAATVRAWRTHPRSERYRPMDPDTLSAFERALDDHLPADGSPAARHAT